jgi:hypothetical protein
VLVQTETNWPFGSSLSGMAIHLQLHRVCLEEDDKGGGIRVYSPRWLTPQSEQRIIKAPRQQLTESPAGLPEFGRNRYFVHPVRGSAGFLATNRGPSRPPFLGPTPGLAQYLQGQIAVCDGGHVASVLSLH